MFPQSIQLLTHAEPKSGSKPSRRNREIGGKLGTVSTMFKNIHPILHLKRSPFGAQFPTLCVFRLKAFQIHQMILCLCRNKNPPEEESFMSNYEMSVELLVRVSRRNDYYVHKIVALVVGGVVVITLFLLLGKKALGHKLGWESKETCNYAPEWNAAPARTIASAGSLHHSRSTLR